MPHLTCGLPQPLRTISLIFAKPIASFGAHVTCEIAESSVAREGAPVIPGNKKCQVAMGNMCRPYSPDRWQRCALIRPKTRSRIHATAGIKPPWIIASPHPFHKRFAAVPGQIDHERIRRTGDFLRKPRGPIAEIFLGSVPLELGSTQGFRAVDLHAMHPGDNPVVLAIAGKGESTLFIEAPSRRCPCSGTKRT